jgi:fatty acid desaturase
LESDFAELARTARRLVDPVVLAGLKKPRPPVVYRATLLIWLQLLGAWAIALFAPLWLVWLPLLVNIAVTQAMLLWVHEASHASLFPSRRRNDIWCDVFFAGPVGISVAAYRVRHLSHHAHLGTHEDQDAYPYRWPIKGPRALARLSLAVLSGGVGAWLAFSKYLRRQDALAPVAYGPRWIAPVVTVAFNGGLLLACIAVGRWYLYPLIWAYPILAIAIALNIVRTIAEHQPEDFPRYEHGRETAMRPVARTTTPGFLEKWLMYQANFNYHVEHHAFPTVPQHNLAILHRHLKEQGLYRLYPHALQRSGFMKFIRLHAARPDPALARAGHQVADA